MPTIHESIEINRPASEVFDYLSDSDNATAFSSNLIEYRLEHPDMERGKGARHVGVVRVAGKKMEFTDEVVEWEPGHRMLMRSVKAPMSWTMEWTVAPIDATSSTVTMHEEVGTSDGFFGKLADPIVTRMYRHDVRSNLSNLKVLLEEVSD
jgi:uncharacterized protein YndB with AHSA1/START domain